MPDLSALADPVSSVGFIQDADYALFVPSDLPVSRRQELHVTQRLGLTPQKRRFPSQNAERRGRNLTVVHVSPHGDATNFY